MVCIKPYSVISDNAVLCLIMNVYTVQSWNRRRGGRACKAQISHILWCDICDAVFKIVVKICFVTRYCLCAEPSLSEVATKIEGIAWMHQNNRSMTLHLRCCSPMCPLQRMTTLRCRRMGALVRGAAVAQAEAHAVVSPQLILPFWSCPIQ